ncbi:LysR family transcriptional regulator [Limoniibacter endophyticus]|uniref:LysR family transcriptional regulator n=1 Tax=Limoniibacter endophyticus TaxID=1565040 RepID=A0A8J3DG11_9HYPH|nr:LysR family transcriptional regulator [Limoniibacter endophyticus]GHC65960.1 LysR family transcriptional regulator [Limoniibacter endophyticus]
MSPDLNALSVFVLVAELRSFRGTAERLGVTRPAVSQSIQRLEETLGLALVRRTTRSVSLTEEGQRLYDDVAPAVADLRAAISSAGELRAHPRGQLRLAVSSIAETFLSGKLLAEFGRANADVQIDVTVTDEEFDIVAEGYDAGVRLGEVIAQDMIAVPVSPQQRQVAVCTPAYLATYGTPQHPRELAKHRCIGWRPAPLAAPYRWEFEENGREFAVSVEPEYTTNDMALMVKLALADAGIAFGMEETFRPNLQNGQLVPLLGKYCPRFSGFYLYYPNRRNLAPKMRALLDHIRRARLTAEKNIPPLG